MKYYIIAGEASGDLHGANLIKAIKRQDANATFRCWGGDLMQAQGAEVIKHYRDLAFMGFIEVVKNLPAIFKNIRFCKEDILQYAPDVLIFIDYPGFNLRIASFAKAHQIKTVYYISPQIWAWKQSRVHQIKRDIDKMLVILPFEKAFYQGFDFEVDFVGHPLLDAIQSLEIPDGDFRLKNDLSQKPIIALLPGSRKQEIISMLPNMMSVVNEFPEYQFVVAVAPGQNKSFYSNLIKNYPVKLVQGATYSLLQNAAAALVTSGTATLETALFNVPEVVCYKGSRISYAIAKRIVKVKYISLVNLIMDKMIVDELIQDDLNPQKLKISLTTILEKNNRELIQQNYQSLKEKLGGPGASDRAAQKILDFLKAAQK
ncbi:MAG: lipid-A-disaccharide synthase [Bacteroidota bacterium]